MTEAEYWRDYEIIKNDVLASIVSYQTHNTLNSLAARDPEVYQKINRHANFWNISSSSWQRTLFIVLARILDHDPKVHSIYQVLNATIAHPEFFSKPALRARKLAIPGTQWNPADLDDYVRNAWEPTVQDLRMMKRALVPHKTKFDAIYRPIRNQIAHIILKDQVLIAALYSRTQKTDIDELLCFLHSLIGAIWHLAFNATPPDLTGDNYGYATRIAEIATDIETLLGQLP